MSVHLQPLSRSPRTLLECDRRTWNLTAGTGSPEHSKPDKGRDEFLGQWLRFDDERFIETVLGR